MWRSAAFVRSFVLLVALTWGATPVRAETAPILQPAGQAAPGGSSLAPRPRRTGLIVGGLVTFAIPYAFGVWAAFASTGSTNEMCPCPQRNTGAGYLLIPVAGPWIAISAAPKDAGLFAFLGIVQATGVALTVGGIVRYSNDGKNPADAGERAAGRGGFISFGALPTRDGAFGFLTGRM
jgi:hypothetical protein